VGADADIAHFRVVYEITHENVSLLLKNFLVAIYLEPVYFSICKTPTFQAKIAFPGGPVVTPENWRYLWDTLYNRKSRKYMQ
jgi:hypothetical protein